MNNIGLCSYKGGKESYKNTLNIIHLKVLHLKTFNLGIVVNPKIRLTKEKKIRLQICIWISK